MKSNVLKIGLPMAVIAFALASAAGTSSLNGKGKDIVISGYERTTANPTPCNENKDCDDDGDFACTANVSGAQLYANDCLTPLKQRLP